MNIEDGQDFLLGGFGAWIWLNCLNEAYFGYLKALPFK
jgi:hypothetical protein